MSIRLISGFSVLAFSVLLIVAACGSSAQLLVGTPRVQIRPEQVKIYSIAPPQFEEVAILNVSSESVLRPGGQPAIDRLIERLRVQAAKLGANGIIMGDFSDEQVSSFGTGVGSESYTHNSSISLSAGTSLGIFKKIGRARAIFVPLR
jgi:hypothetical protein